MTTQDLINRLRDTASKGVSVWGDLQMEAAKEIETLLAERECYASAMDRMQAALAEPEGEPSTVLRLIDTIKYLVGIAERGEGRKARDDELPEQFVLGYVKRLEAALAEPEPSEPVAWSITYNGEHCGNLYSDEFTAKTKCASMNAMWLKDTRVLVPLFTHPASKP